MFSRMDIQLKIVHSHLLLIWNYNLTSQFKIIIPFSIITGFLLPLAASKLAYSTAAAYYKTHINTKVG